MENPPFEDGISYWKRWISIARLVYRRVDLVFAERPGDEFSWKALDSLHPEIMFVAPQNGGGVEKTWKNRVLKH